MRPTIRRLKREEAGRRPTAKQLLDLILPVATLVLGIVSLWTTIQISGLEDYFRSEIVRRNEDISALGIRYLEAERGLDRREERISRLGDESDRLESLNDEQRAALVSAMLQSNKMETDATLAARQLEGANRRAEMATALIREREVTLETLYRKEVKGRITGAAFSLQIRAILQARPSAHSRKIGAELVEILNTATVDDPTLQPSLADLKRRFPSVCPAFQDLEISLPAEPVRPTYDEPPFRPVRTAEDRNEFMAIWALEIERDVANYRDRQTAYTADVSRIWDTASDQFRSCVCTALATEEIGADAICSAET